MACCGYRVLDDEVNEVDEDGAEHEGNSGHFAGDNPACQETDWDGRRSRALLTAQADDRSDAGEAWFSILWETPLSVLFSIRLSRSLENELT